MEISPAQDSRRFDRKNHEYHFVGRHCDSNGNVRLFSGRTLDISLRGLGGMIDSNDILMEGDTVDLSLRIFPGEPPIKVVGLVSWRTKDVTDLDKRTRLGVELTGMTNPVHSYKRWLEILTWN